MLRIAALLYLSLFVASLAFAKDCDDRLSKLLVEERLEDTVDELFIAQHDDVFARRRCVRLQFEQLTQMQKLHQRRLVKALSDCRSDLCRQGVQDALKKVEARIADARKQFDAADAAVEKGTPVPPVVPAGAAGAAPAAAAAAPAAAGVPAVRGALVRDGTVAGAPAPAAAPVTISTIAPVGAVSVVRSPLGFPLDQTLDWYKQMCQQDPTNALACSTGHRILEIKDVNALAVAKQDGITINMPPPDTATARADYQVTIEDTTLDSGIVMQLKNGIIRQQKAALKALQATTTEAGPTTPPPPTVPGQTFPPTPPPTPAPTAPPLPPLTCKDVPGGRALVTPAGMTLYQTKASPTNPTGFCTQSSGCLPFWPMPPTDVSAGAGVNCQVGTVTRSDTGADQLTCGGIVLYQFKDDTPGTQKGLAFNSNDFQLASC